MKNVWIMKWRCKTYKYTKENLGWDCKKDCQTWQLSKEDAIDCRRWLLLLHSFNGLFFQDNPGKPAPEKQNYSGKTNLDLLEQEIVSGSCIRWGGRYAILHLTADR